MGRAAWGAVAVAVGLLVLKSCQLERAQAAFLAVALRETNLQAQLDTTKRLAVKGRADSAYWHRQALQEEQRADAVSRVLRAERRARTEVSVSVPALDTAVAAPVADSAGVRVAHFGPVRQEPYTFQARAALPPPPEPAQLEVQIDLDPIPLGLSLLCGPRAATGVRSAEVVVRSPPWAQVQLGALSQAPEICNPPKPKGRSLLEKGLWVLGAVKLGELVVGVVR